MRRLIPFLVIYVLVQSRVGESVRVYEGQTAEQVRAVIASEGKTATFISEKDYQDFLALHQPSTDLDPIRQQAKDDLNTVTKTERERIDAIIKYLGLEN